jgi:signal transduction histidine kinase
MFRELSLWARDKGVFITGSLAILFLILLAFYLQYSRTQLKLARDAQSQLSGLLINAQDKERSRLAAELHDDFSQRVAMLRLGLEKLPASNDGAKQQLEELKESATELGDDLRTLSHRLHSSTVQILGLNAELRALCKEFASRQKIHIEFFF